MIKLIIFDESESNWPTSNWIIFWLKESW